MTERPSWVDVTLEEYRTLREESLQALRQQQIILQLGLAALGVLIGLGVRTNDATVIAVLLMLFVPWLSLLIVLIWAGELQRMVRAGAHVRRIERRISVEYEQQWPLQWETLLASDHPLPRASTASIERSSSRFSRYSAPVEQLSGPSDWRSAVIGLQWGSSAASICSSSLE